jgi:hypothetical protein
MTLMLHAGANPVEYDALRQLETPLPMQMHMPTRTSAWSISSPTRSPTTATR